MTDLTGTLNNTLLSIPKTPQLTGDSKQDISSLQSAYHPGMLANVASVSALIARTAYQERQSKEMDIMGKQFDPTKVSGNTFASIIQNVEQNRGTDISKMYSSSMNAYQQGQAEIKDDLNRLKDEEKQKADELRQLQLQFPDAEIKAGDSTDTIALKIKKSNEKKTVIDLYTQTFGSFPSGMSLSEMNNKLKKKYKNYDAKKQAAEIARLEGGGDVDTAEKRDSFVKEVASRVYSGNIANREDAAKLIEAQFPGSGNMIYNYVSNNYVSNKSDDKTDDPFAFLNKT